jgi:outer membrane protein OmpA-like peptidoglycan-associated protein
MSFRRDLIVIVASTLLLGACAGQPQTYQMNSGQSVTMPKGTMTGAASVGNANALAQMIADGNTNAMQQFDKLGGDMNRMQASQNQDLQNSQAALTKLEQLSDQQGSGQITLFFAEGSAQLNNEQQQRLIRFLDYISRESAGRTVVMVSIGSASAVGPASVNRQLSIQRSQSPLQIINQYLVNTPHEFYKVSSVGDMYAPRDASAQVDQRYQNVRIVAAYDKSQLPGS